MCVCVCVFVCVGVSVWCKRDGEIFHQAIQVFLTVSSCPPQKLVYRDSLLTVRRGAIIGLGRKK